ncbi:hypothetical protein QR680_017380 [Steinernema hermaphroditum]|uniref:HAT C-terminal dimerisation domain-containing protein n=1 Tax=Steinernema hermaphroditum TaxID=289476 RepID=A0AA39HGC3_9BILA|nr:hypothetical protein QR680_017380 [Steinernema hermaphroditum]
MDYAEGASDDHSNIDDRDLPFEFATNGDDAEQSPDCISSTATSSCQRSSHPIYQYVTRTATEWNCKTCERCFKGPRLFNITRHFKRSHPEVFAEAETMRLQMNPDEVASYLAPLISAASNGRASSPSTSATPLSFLKNAEFEVPQLTVKQAPVPKKPCQEKSFGSEKTARRLLTSLVSSGVLSSSLLDNLEFRKLLSLVPGFAPPSAKDVEQLVENDTRSTFARVSQILNFSLSYLSSLALSVDVHMQDGTLPGFIAVFGHYYSVQTKSFEMLLLNIADLPDNSPKHLVDSTVTNVLCKFSSQLSLNHPKISRVTTLEVPRLEPQYKRPYINLFTDQFGNQRELDESDYCAVSCCPERLTVVANRFEDSNVPDQLTKEDLLNKKSYGWIGRTDSSKHVVCAATIMQQVMAKVFQNDSEVSAIMGRIMEILRKLNSSIEIIRSLMERTNGNELRIPRNSRWCSVLGAFDRFLTLAPQIEGMCKENGWQFLSEKELEFLTKLNTVTNPILRFTERLQATDSPTISLLLPGLIKLMEHLKKHNAELSSDHALKLVSEIEKCFAHVLKSGEPGYDPIYIVSTLLDRRVAHMVVDHDTRKQRKVIMATISKMFPEVRDQCEANGNEIVLEDSSPFGFGTVSSSISVPSASSLEGSEIVPYFHRFIRLPTSSSSIEFWIEHDQEFPVLSKVATAILSIPASTVQTISSIATANAQIANQLKNLQCTKLPKHIRSSVYLTFNKHLLKSEEDARSLSEARSDTSCSPTPNREQVQKVSKKHAKSVLKHDIGLFRKFRIADLKTTSEIKEEQEDYISRKSPRLEMGLNPPKLKAKKPHSEERRLSSASSSSKSSASGCR